MKSNTIRNVMQKIIISILLIIITTGFVVPNYVQAVIDTGISISKDEASVDGGTIFIPIKKLLVIIADAVMSGVQSILMKDAQWVNFYVEPNDKSGDYWDDLGDDHIAYPGYLVLTPEAIFSNNVNILNPNFVTNSTLKIGTIDGNTYQSSIRTFRKTIAKWYVALRTLALVGLLSVLVYVRN